MHCIRESGKLCYPRPATQTGGRSVTKCVTICAVCCAASPHTACTILSVRPPDRRLVSRPALARLHCPLTRLMTARQWPQCSRCAWQSRADTVTSSLLPGRAPCGHDRRDVHSKIIFSIFLLVVGIHMLAILALRIGRVSRTTRLNSRNSFSPHHPARVSGPHRIGTLCYILCCHAR